MSANENRRVVERLLTAFTDGDLETAKRALAQDFVNHDPPRLPGVGTDRAGVLAAIEYLHSAFAGARAEPVTILAEGDKVAVHDRLRGTHRGDFLGIPPTGRDITVDFVHIFRVADGLIVERWGVADTDALLEQLDAAP
jgi:predicted ester cyclase